MTATWLDGAALRAFRVERSFLFEVADRVDPYLVWAATSGALDGLDWIPLLVELEGSAAEFARLARNESGTWTDWVRMPPWYEAPTAGLQDTRHACAWVRPRFFACLTGPGPVFGKTITRFEFGLSPPVQPARHAHVPDPPFGELLNAGNPAPVPLPHAAIVGIVDDGIAFAHGRFLDRRGRPRVRHFWDQRVAQGVPAFKPALPVPHGLEWPASAPAQKAGPGPESLEELLAANLHAGMVDEDALYARAGQSQLGAHARHGTHVLDIAAGADPAVEPDAPPIVAVQLPEAVGADPSGALLAPQLFDALRFVVDRADRHAKAAGLSGPAPVVVNLSYGLYGGPHDGTSLLETAMENLVAQREGIGGLPLSIVVAAGNLALSRCHASVELGPTESRTLRWRIPPDSRAPAFLELWLGHGTPDVPRPKVTVRLVPPVPTTNAAPSVGAGGYAELLDGTWDTTAPNAAPASAVIATVSYVAEVSATGQPSYYNQRDMVLLTVWPTAGLDAARPWAPHGDWTVEVVNGAGQPIEVHGWIRRNDTPFGFAARGRQSRFDDAGYRVRDDGGRLVEQDGADGPIRRSETLNGIGTGRGVVVVGAGRRDGGRPAAYTSRGPVLPLAAAQPPHRTGPDLLAPADTSAARPGVLGAGTRGRSMVALNGTSVAAPAVTRQLARVFARGGASTTPEALAQIITALPAAASSAADAPRAGGGWLARTPDGVRVPR